MKLSFIFFVCLGVQYLFAQQSLPIIHAHSQTVRIKDGGFLRRNNWNLSPTTKPDIYYADRANKEKWVTFYTDIDSFRVKVVPNEKYDFVILLNGKDSCYTQIQSQQAPKLTFEQEKHDTIPFFLSENHNICFKACVNEKDTLMLMFDTGATAFPITQSYLSTKANSLVSEKTVLKQYQALPVNTLKISNRIWHTPRALMTINSGHGTDGLIGWDLFDGEILEIDYDKKIMIAHSSLPESAEMYSKHEITFVRSLLCIEANLPTKKGNLNRLFLVDSGFDGAMMLDSSLQSVSKDWQYLSSSTYSNASGQLFENKIYLAPSLNIANTQMSNIPAKQINGENHIPSPINILGNDLLMRFNTILDFQQDCIYLKPNSLWNLPYKEAS